MVEILFARNLRAITVGRIAVGILPPSLLLLIGTRSLPLVVAFTLLMGASQGAMTIVRGAVPRGLRFEGLRGCAWRDRHPSPRRQCGLTVGVHLDHGPLGLGIRTDVAPGWCLGGMDRHGADVALVRRPASDWRARATWCRGVGDRSTQGPSQRVGHARSAAAVALRVTRASYHGSGR